MSANKIYSGHDDSNKTKLSWKERWSLAGMFSLAMVANFIAAWWLAISIFFGSRNRSWRIMLAYDQLANAAFGGSEDETISSRAGRERDKGKKWGCYLCKVLDWLDKDHCTNAKETFIKDLHVHPSNSLWLGTYPHSVLEDDTWAPAHANGAIFQVLDVDGNEKGIYAIRDGVAVPLTLTILP